MLLIVAYIDKANVTSWLVGIERPLFGTTVGSVDYFNVLFELNVAKQTSDLQLG